MYIKREVICYTGPWKDVDMGLRVALISDTKGSSTPLDLESYNGPGFLLPLHSTDWRMKNSPSSLAACSMRGRGLNSDLYSILYMSVGLKP